MYEYGLQLNEINPTFYMSGAHFCPSRFEEVFFSPTGSKIEYLLPNYGLSDSAGSQEEPSAIWTVLIKISVRKEGRKEGGKPFCELYVWEMDIFLWLLRDDLHRHQSARETDGYENVGLRLPSRSREAYRQPTGKEDGEKEKELLAWWEITSNSVRAAAAQ